MTMQVTAMADGEWVNIGDMVQVPDTYDTNQQAGYIVSRVGNDFETSERINFSEDHVCAGHGFVRRHHGAIPGFSAC
jgi:hypothetical protein